MNPSLYKTILSFYCPRQLHPHSRSQPAILFPIALRKQRPTEGKSLTLPTPRQPTSLARVPCSSFPPMVHYGRAVCAPSQGQSFLLYPITYTGAQCLQRLPLSPITRVSLSLEWAAKILSNIHSQSSPLLPYHAAALSAASTHLPPPYSSVPPSSLCSSLLSLCHLDRECSGLTPSGSTFKIDPGLTHRHPSPGLLLGS